MTLAAELEVHRPALSGHCYRMLGSVVDADDAVQETMLRAWRSRDGFAGRASIKSWLFRIATNVCLDALADRSGRERTIAAGPSGSVDDPLVEQPRTHWCEPIPDARALPRECDPAELAVLRQSIRLAFVAALQHLPPKQRAVLLLADVLGWSAAEIAASIGTSVPAVNSALQRARATLAARGLGAASLSDPQSELLARYVEAFERHDVAALTSLLHEGWNSFLDTRALLARVHRRTRSRALGLQGGVELPTRTATHDRQP
jgi:RNA polymerase sigma-70 factor (ECF subfamily)